jgi:hypothetical protein
MSDPDANIAMLGTAVPAFADAGLNPDGKDVRMDPNHDQCVTL